MYKRYNAKFDQARYNALAHQVFDATDTEPYFTTPYKVRKDTTRFFMAAVTLIAQNCANPFQVSPPAQARVLDFIDTYAVALGGPTLAAAAREYYLSFQE